MPTASAYIGSTKLTSAVGFTTSMSLNNLLGSFSLSLNKASLWNTRVKSGIVDISASKFARILFGQVVNGETIYVPVFKGYISQVGESYSFGNEESIDISGYSMAQKLKYFDGTYSSSSFTGYSKTLIEYWCEAASIEYTLSYTDNLYMTDVLIDYSNILTGLTDVLQALGPNIEGYFDSSGKLIIRDVVKSPIEFYYDQSTIRNLKPLYYGENVYTEATVVGSPATVTSTATASSAYTDKYGTQNHNLTSDLIQDQDYADNLASAILSNDLKMANPVSFDIALNPYLTIGSRICLKDSSLSSIPNQLLRISEIKHGFSPNQSHTTSVTGYFF